MIDADILAEAGALLSLLRERTLTVVTAESCTAGLVAASLTHHAGSSAAVLGGFVTYSREAKQRMVGVPAALLERHGTISAECAEAMAEGALDRMAADLAVSVTGLAGPDPDENKPVGLVWFGLARRGGSTETVSRHLAGDRAAIRAAATRHALAMLHDAATAMTPR
jgi:nicotinamide-nucleotide amidase